MKPWKNSLAVGLLSSAAVAGGFFGGATLLDRVQFAHAESQVEISRQQLTHIEDLSSVFREVNKVIEPSVVKIEVTKTIKVPHTSFDPDQLRRFFRDNGQEMPDIPGLPDNGNGNGNGGANGGGGEQDFQQEGTGSGVIMETGDGYGYILTNNHVAGGASEITVTLSDGRVIQHGHLMGADPKSDLAVVRIKAGDLIPAHWGDSDELQQGDWVLAFGSPLGYSGSMTHGIVSALNRRDVGIINQGYEDFIQVDAPINPGNSGGPLVNLHGEVVGINTAIASRTGFFNGIGFAIPSDQAHKVFQTLKTSGKVVRGWLGISISNVSGNLPVARSFGFTHDSGVLVEGPRPNTPAWGKLVGGDIITAYNGQSVANVDQLRDAVANTAPGTAVKVTIFRDGQSQDVALTVGNQPEDLTEATPESARPGSSGGEDNHEMEAAALGLKLQTVNDELSQQLGLEAGTTGAVITDVKTDSVAAKAGLRPGYVITHVGRTEVLTAVQAYNALSRVDIKKGVRLTILTPAGSDFVFLQQQEEAPSNN